MIIDFAYNLNKYAQYKSFWKLSEVGFLHQLTVIALYHWIRMESCSKFLRILVATVHFTDQNWNSKTLCWSLPAVDNILENALSSKSKKPIKFVHLQNVTNQSMFDYAVVIEMIETSTAFFIKARKILRCAIKREMFSLKNKTKDGEYYTL